MTSQRPRNIRSALLEPLTRPGGLAMGFSAAALGLIAYFVLPSWQISAQVLAAVVVVFLTYIWTSGSALAGLLSEECRLSTENARLTSQVLPHAPKVIHAIMGLVEEDEFILLLEESRLYGQSMLVSIYYEDERHFEILVASGIVANVQTNGKIQVRVNQWIDAHSSIKRAIVGGENAKLSRLLVRPAQSAEFVKPFDSYNEANHPLSNV